jgi:hypothetical protein
MKKTINYGTKFKFEWAEGNRSETDKYVGKELCFQEFIYIITKRHHEIASRNITEGFYGTYDKHKCWVKYDDDSDWEILDRLDLGNDEDFVYIRKMIMDNFTPDVELYWSEVVQEGAELWELRENEADGITEAERNWLKYEKVRLSGEYNMITEAGFAMYKANLDKDEYVDVMHNYSDLKKQVIEKLGEEKVKQLTEEA